MVSARRPETVTRMSRSCNSTVFSPLGTATKGSTSEGENWRVPRGDLFSESMASTPHTSGLCNPRADPGRPHGFCRAPVDSSEGRQFGDTMRNSRPSSSHPHRPTPLRARHWPLPPPPAIPSARGPRPGHRGACHRQASPWAAGQEQSPVRVKHCMHHRTSLHGGRTGGVRMWLSDLEVRQAVEQAPEAWWMASRQACIVSRSSRVLSWRSSVGSRFSPSSSKSASGLTGSGHASSPGTWHRS